ncbi:g13445 [Coccomyxa viridis]|uniref:G13445 protein n=1 Tax=Coccomyxa viridis TaxID=1274662 RepID=A0ABP1GFF5_9CHLO
MESADNVGAAIAAVAGSFPSSKAETFANTQHIQQLIFANAQLNSSLSALELEVDGLKAQAKGATGANGQAGATGAPHPA